MKNIFFVFLGGGLGSIARFLLGKLLNNQFETLFPLGTFAANLIGCFLIGLIYAILQKNELLNTYWSFLLVTGFCGGFTTFSSFSFENNTLAQNGELGTALFYTALSLCLGFLCTWIGFKIIG